MFNAFNAYSNPEMQEFLFPFPFEEAIVQDSNHLPKVIVFDSNPPHLASDSLFPPTYNFTKHFTLRKVEFILHFEMSQKE